ncbi:MAG: type II toxin-antitoxin system RatA family toxin [Rhodospirillaceae bacterium]|nr:type II toxin-antitoxin system RatA family toxin [Rhodospirillaceae bacterium]
MHSHAEKKVLPYTPEQMFDMVADVAAYPDFLPWCIATRVRSQDETHLLADMVIGFKMFREQFTSRVTLERPGVIHVEYERGPFKYLKNQWNFESDADGNCLVDFNVEFEFRSQLLEMAIGKVFTEAVLMMVAAFEKRARFLYG